MTNKTYEPRAAEFVRKLYAYNFRNALALNLSMHDGRSGYSLASTVYFTEEGVKAMKRAIRACEKQHAEMEPIETGLEPR
jgi:hypothetical protein